MRAPRRSDLFAPALGITLLRPATHTLTTLLIAGAPRPAVRHTSIWQPVLKACQILSYEAPTILWELGLPPHVQTRILVAHRRGPPPPDQQVRARTLEERGFANTSPRQTSAPAGVIDDTASWTIRATMR